VDPILTYSLNQKDYTFLGKGDLEKQVPVLKKKYLYFHNFAGKPVTEIFGDSLNTSHFLSANSFASGVFYNLGNGRFSFKPFPAMAQSAPLFAFGLMDYYKGLLAGGNFYGVIPYEGRYDADWGDILALNKRGGFDWLSPVKTGFCLRGEVRDIKTLKTSLGPLYVVAFNNQEIRFFRQDTKHVQSLRTAYSN